MSAQDVALYYDELHRWTARDRDFQVFSGLGVDTTIVYRGERRRRGTQ